MTFNIRYDEESDGRHAWVHRRSLVLDIVQSHQPDLLGLQEPTATQWDWIVAALPDHSPFGVVDHGWGDVEPHGGLFRTTRFEPLASDLFWLSETPSVARSESWPNDWGPRACGWVKLRDRLTDRTLVFACTHLDTNAAARLPSVKVLHSELDKVAGALPVILVGDFNCVAGSDAYRYLRDEAMYRDACRETGNADDGVVTFNGFTTLRRLPDTSEVSQHWSYGSPVPTESLAHLPSDARTHGNYRIDWILLRGGIVATSTLIDYRNDNGLLASDHYPVVVHIEYAPAPSS